MPRKLELRLEVKDDGSVVIRRFAGTFYEVQKKISAAARKASAEVGKASAKTVQAFRRIATEVGKVGRAIDRTLTASFGRLRNALTSVAGMLGITMGAAGVLGFARSLIQANQQVEDFAASLQVLYGSADVARQKLQEFILFARKTPFTTPEVVQAARLLKVFGVEGKQALTVIGDAAAAAQRPLSELAFWIGRLRAGDTGEAIMRLSEMGLITREQIMKAVGAVRMEDLRNNISKTYDAAIKLIREKTKGMMDVMQNTMTGRLAALQSLWWEFRQKAGEALFKRFGDDIAKFEKRIEEAFDTGEFDRWAGKVSDAMVKAYDILRKTGRILIWVISTFVHYRKVILAVVSAWALYKVGARAAFIWTNLLKAAAEQNIPVLKLLGMTLKSAFATTLVGALMVAVSYLIMKFISFTKSVGGLKNAFRLLWEQAKTVVSGIAKLFWALVKPLALVEKALAFAYTGHFKKSAEAFKEVGQAFKDYRKNISEALQGVGESFRKAGKLHEEYVRRAKEAKMTGEVTPINAEELIKNREKLTPPPTAPPPSSGEITRAEQQALAQLTDAVRQYAADRYKLLSDELEKEKALWVKARKPVEDFERYATEKRREALSKILSETIQGFDSLLSEARAFGKSNLDVIRQSFDKQREVINTYRQELESLYGKDIVTKIFAVLDRRQAQQTKEALANLISDFDTLVRKAQTFGRSEVDVLTEKFRQQGEVIQKNADAIDALYGSGTAERMLAVLQEDYQNKLKSIYDEARKDDLSYWMSVLRNSQSTADQIEQAWQRISEIVAAGGVSVGQAFSLGIADAMRHVQNIVMTTFEFARAQTQAFFGAVQQTVADLFTGVKDWYQRSFRGFVAQFRQAYSQLMGAAIADKLRNLFGNVGISTPESRMQSAIVEGSRVGAQQLRQALVEGGNQAATAIGQATGRSVAQLKGVAPAVGAKGRSLPGFDVKTLALTQAMNLIAASQRPGGVKAPDITETLGTVAGFFLGGGSPFGMAVGGMLGRFVGGLFGGGREESHVNEQLLQESRTTNRQLEALNRNLIGLRQDMQSWYVMQSSFLLSAKSGPSTAAAIADDLELENSMVWQGD